MRLHIALRHFARELWQEISDADIFSGAAALAFCEAATMFVGVVEDVTSQLRGGLLSFGLLGAPWANSTGMAAIMTPLNVSYRVVESRGVIRSRLIAIGLSLLTAFAVLRWVIVVLGLLLAFALIYYLAPDVKQRFVFITHGSVIGVAALTAASPAFAWYAQRFGDYSATYGSIGEVIVLMLWLYIAGLVIVLGSQVNALVEHHAGAGKVKGEHAEGDRERDPATRRAVARAAAGRRPESRS